MSLGYRARVFILEVTTMTYRRKKNKLDFINIKKVFFVSDPVKRMKKNKLQTERKYLLTIYQAKGLVSRISKELSKCDRKKKKEEEEEPKEFNYTTGKRHEQIFY